MASLEIPPMNDALGRAVARRLSEAEAAGWASVDLARINPQAAARQALGRLMAADGLLRDAVTRYFGHGCVRRGRGDIRAFARHRHACRCALRDAIDRLNRANADAERRERETEAAAARDRAAHLVAQLGLERAGAYIDRSLRQQERRAEFASADPAALWVIMADIAELEATQAALRRLRQDAA